MRIADLLGEPQRLPELREALVAAAEVGEVAAEHRERPDLRLARADRASERERLLADRQRLVVAPGQHQPARERPPAPTRAPARAARAGTSSTARSNAASAASSLPLACR